MVVLLLFLVLIRLLMAVMIRMNVKNPKRFMTPSLALRFVPALVILAHRLLHPHRNVLSQVILMAIACPMVIRRRLPIIQRPPAHLIPVALEAVVMMAAIMEAAVAVVEAMTAAAVAGEVVVVHQLQTRHPDLIHRGHLTQVMAIGYP
jgi:hypothetical protein